MCSREDDPTQHLEDQPPVPGGTTAIRDGQYVTEERAPGPPTPEKGLPPAWIVFEACPKCGCTIPGVKWRPGGPACEFDLDVEHFHATCWRCSFKWAANMKGKRL